jgi:hypothetical protein
MTALDLLDRISIGRPIKRGPFRAYPLYQHGPTAGEYLNGPEASARNLVSVDEADSTAVPTLSVTNRGDVPVLLIDGETFEGGLQNRMLNVNVLLAAGRSEVPVSCVEAGRWGGRRTMGRSTHHAPSAVRQVMVDSVNASVRHRGSKHSDQGGVWHEVGRTLHDRKMDSRTAALHDVFSAQADDVIYRSANQLAEVGPLPEQTGVALVGGGRVLSVELFDRQATLAAYWRQLMASHAFDGLDPTAERPSMGSVLRFVRHIARAAAAPAEGVGLGTELHIQGNGVFGSGLEWDGALLHLSAFAAV